MARKNSDAEAKERGAAVGEPDGTVAEEGQAASTPSSSCSSSDGESGSMSDDGERQDDIDGNDHGGGSDDDSSGSSGGEISDEDREGGEEEEEGESSQEKEEEGAGEGEKDPSGAGPVPSAGPVCGERCSFDPANLAAFNTHQVNVARLYSADAGRGKLDPGWYAGDPTISVDGRPPANESFLLSKAAEGATQLLAELWELPKEKSDVGPIARLPSQGETRLPRSLPPPPPKQQTKWEQFALQRGIAPKSKRSRKVFDEATGEWKHLTGSLRDKANVGPELWPIIEVKKNDDPMADPWEKLRDEKKSRAQRNVEARMRNAERAGTLEKGSANRAAKASKLLERQRDIAREKERMRGLVAPAGVPLDVRSDAKRGKPSTQLALRATQVSTASLGRFDMMREGEPEKKKMLSKSVHGSKKRKQDHGGGGTNKKFLQNEVRKSKDILQKVMGGGSSSKEKEQDIRRGRYAKGETAYDYEFDDGLGAGSFKRKKGRAGMGKLKKMTKKRIK